MTDRDWEMLKILRREAALKERLEAAEGALEKAREFCREMHEDRGGGELWAVLRDHCQRGLVALKGEGEEPPRRRLILGVADQLAEDSEDLERP